MTEDVEQETRANSLAQLTGLAEKTEKMIR